MTQRRISIIATVLNESAALPALLHSLSLQTTPPDRIVIVDGGSTDGTWEALLAAVSTLPHLRPLRDASCSRKFSAGPIARGRNVAIHTAETEIIACVDAGCSYAPEWLGHLTAPLRDGSAEYVLGGSCLDLGQASLADLAAAPFLGVKLDADAPTKSCTARSMAFTTAAWARAGGFPETLFIGEDVLFDQRMRASARTVFVSGAKAIYTPRLSFGQAISQLGSYAIADGVAGLRPVRLLRNVLRCAGMLVAALLIAVQLSRALRPAVDRGVLPALWPAWLIAAAVMFLEVYWALRLDFGSMLRLPQVRRRLAGLLPARLALSLLVPWIVSSHQLLGMLRKAYRVNRQNA